MKKSISIIALSTLMLFAMSCDKIDIDNTHKPYVPSSGGKTVLIKDFTGVRCVNCPAAAEAAHELQHQFGDDRVFLITDLAVVPREKPHTGAAAREQPRDSPVIER